MGVDANPRIAMINPRGQSRHEHEWRVWETVKLPDEKISKLSRDQNHIPPPGLPLV
jgi:hypothetical protein